ncbi:MAG: MarR family transcriptional regulator [Actinobacteria bacterium]|nr:MarR family transcriptional regulator [Actinomycetota bacterium]
MEHTRWLDAEQQQHWRAYIDGSSRLLERLERVLRDCHGLSMPEYEILVRLSEAPDRQLRMAELADAVSLSRSRLSHTIARLEVAELVCRRGVEADGRGVVAVLTEAGYVKLDAASHEHVQSVRQYFIDVVPAEDLAVIGRVFQTVSETIIGTRRPGNCC